MGKLEKYLTDDVLIDFFYVYVISVVFWIVYRKKFEKTSKFLKLYYVKLCFYKT